MTVTRINEFRARPGPLELESLVTHLRLAVAGIRKTLGCTSCQLLQSQADPLRFVIIEKWKSIEAHQAAASKIPKSAITAMMKLLAEAPRGDYLLPP